MADSPMPHPQQPRPDRAHLPTKPALGACGCGSGCSCGCQSGGPCQCGGCG